METVVGMVVTRRRSSVQGRAGDIGLDTIGVIGTERA
jgi:hypothetical protein